MKKRKEYFVVSIVLLFAFLIVVALNLFDKSSITGNFIKEGTAYNCSNCTDCIAAIADASAGDTIYLNNTISAAVSDCIDMSGASNIIFDCINHSNHIQGDGIITDVGIGLVGSYNNTIRNCNVSNFQSGLYIETSSNNTIINSDFFGNGIGINLLADSFNNTVVNSLIRENAEQGIYRANILNDGNSLIGVNISKNKYGVYLEGAPA